jgi:pyruvate dehydrogenase E1 component alpha subunit
MAEKLSRAKLLRLYEQMVLIRETELALAQLFADGEIPGFIHLCIGQEGIAVGVAAALEVADTIATTHRGHGHALAKGVDLRRFLAEVLGKDEGLCRGRGGSMHLADTKVGMLGANGIVGAGLPIALGSALAHQVRADNAIAVAFFGDGALGEGAVHETWNLGALWKLPLLLVCEDNGWSEFTRSEEGVALKLPLLAQAFGLPYRCVDGNDVVAVHEGARTLVAGVRKRKGPAVLHCTTQRARGHFEGDPQRYRDDAGNGLPTADADPLHRLEQRLLRQGAEQATLQRSRARVEARLQEALTEARAGAVPDFATAMADVYTN